MAIGTLAALRRYPVKSLHGEALDSVDVQASGIPGDRASALVARAGARAGKTYRGKENDRLHLIADTQRASALARERGVEVEVCEGEHFFDDAPISIIVDTWLEPLSEHLGYTVEWERFRPNFFVVADDGKAAPEETLVDRRLQLGTVGMRVRSPIERCVAITYHPRGEASDPRILRFLAERRNAWLGIYCDVLEPGFVRVGDRLICA